MLILARQLILVQQHLNEIELIHLAIPQNSEAGQIITCTCIPKERVQSLAEVVSLRACFETNSQYKTAELPALRPLFNVLYV